MLKEIHHVRQEPAAGRRRWFDDDILPLEFIVWYSKADAIDGFQICYDLGRGEYALTWRSKVGFAHSSVDTGSAGPFANLTPVLVADGVVPWSEVTTRFETCSNSLEPALREFVQRQLASHS